MAGKFSNYYLFTVSEPRENLTSNLDQTKFIVFRTLSSKNVPYICTATSFFPEFFPVNRNAQEFVYNLKRFGLGIVFDAIFGFLVLKNFPV